MSNTSYEIKDLVYDENLIAALNDLKNYDIDRIKALLGEAIDTSNKVKPEFLLNASEVQTYREMDEYQREICSKAMQKYGINNVGSFFSAKQKSKFYNAIGLVVEIIGKIDTFIDNAVDYLEENSIEDNENLVPLGDEASTPTEVKNEVSLTPFASAVPSLDDAVADTSTTPYTIIAYVEDETGRYAIAIMNGQTYRLMVDENGNIIPGQDAELIEKRKLIVDIDTEVDYNGEKIKVKAGEYAILYITYINGVRYGLVCIDGKYYWVQLDDNNNIVPNGTAILAENLQSSINGIIYININGQSVAINLNSCEILATKELNGQTYGLILQNGKYYWVPLDENGNIINNSKALEATVIKNNDGIVIYDIQNIDGKIYGLIFKNGKYYWVELDDKNNVIPGTEIPGIMNKPYDLKSTITFDVNGEIIELKPGEYQVLSVTELPDGTTVYCLLVNGKKVWIYVDGDGNIIKKYIEHENQGVYELDQTLNIVDANGNIIGEIKPGLYHIYAIKYDELGNIIAVRISPPGKEEQWIYVRNNDGNMIGEFTPLEKQEENEGNKNVKYSFFEKNKILLGGLLGLAAIVGAAVFYKKKKSTGEKSEEFSMNNGEYPIFEAEKDDNDKVVALRVSNEPNSDDDYWVEV